MRLTGTLLDDLEGLPPERWCVTDFKALLNDPMRELERICEFVVDRGRPRRSPGRCARCATSSRCRTATPAARSRPS